METVVFCFADECCRQSPARTRDCVIRKKCLICFQVFCTCSTGTRPNRSACPTRSPASTPSELSLLVPSRSSSPWRCWSPPAWPSTSKTRWGTCTMSSATSGEDGFCCQISFVEHLLPDVLHTRSVTGGGEPLWFSHLDTERKLGSCLLCKKQNF